MIPVHFFFFGPGGLCAPCVAWPLLSPTFTLSSFFLAQAACVRHACLRAPLLLPSFSLSSSSFFWPRQLACLEYFSPFFAFTHFGESPMCEIIFPLICIVMEHVITGYQTYYLKLFCLPEVLWVLNED